METVRDLGFCVSELRASGVEGLGFRARGYDVWVPG